MSRDGGVVEVKDVFLLVCGDEVGMWGISNFGLSPLAFDLGFDTATASNSLGTSAGLGGTSVGSIGGHRGS